MMTFGVNFVCLVIVATVLKTSQAIDPAVNINYTCNGNGIITIDKTTIQSYKRYAVGQYTFDKNGQMKFGTANKCKVDLKDLPDPITDIALPKCQDFPVYVYFMTDTQVFGGMNYHEYSLNCSTAIDGSSSSVAKIASPVVKATVVKENKEFFSIPLEMELSPDSNVKIADPVKVTIKKGTDSVVKGYILPTRCNATNGKKDGDLKEVLLLDNGISEDPEVLKKFTINEDETASATLYAFMFMDSDTVNLNCNVTLCATKWCSDALAGIYENKPNARRRRSIDKKEKGEVFHVSATMRLDDKVAETKTSGQKSVHLNHLSVFVLLAIVSTKLRMR